MCAQRIQTRFCIAQAKQNQDNESARGQGVQCSGQRNGEDVWGEPESQWAEFLIIYCFRSSASLLPSIGVYN